MDLDTDVPLLDPAGLPRVLSRRQALEAGYTRAAITHRLGRGQWRRILPAVYATTDTVQLDDRRRAALLFAGEDALLSGAAGLCDLGLASVPRPTSLLVLVAPQVRARSVAFVRIRRTAWPVEPERCLGPARACFARCVADLALETPSLDAVRTLLADVTRRRLCTVAELEEALERSARRGSAHLRAAMLEIAEGAWSAPEAEAARVLRACGIGGFEQNARVTLPSGRYLYVDFLWRDLRAVLEIDSKRHHTLPADADATSSRHLALETLGFSVIHRTPRLVYREPAAFAAGVRAWLTARAAMIDARSDTLGHAGSGIHRIGGEK